MRKTVLIVEDNPLVAFTYIDVVEQILGCTTLLTASAGQAWSMLETGLDLALLDVEVADGVTYPLAAHLVERGIPIIFMSGSDPGLLPQELSHLPFLKKPVFPSELLSAARPYL